MKIQKIVLNNFRGFPGPLDYEFQLNGRNLLLYGENGSGKSSLYRALAEMFQPGASPKAFSDFRNIFVKDATGQQLMTGKVAVEFAATTGATFVAEWSETQDRTPLVTGAAPELDLTARSLGCLDYRAMLKTNFVHGSNSVNLFPIIVKDLLHHAQVVTGATRNSTLGDLWLSVRASKPRSHRGTRWERRQAHALGVWNSNFRPLMLNLAGRINLLLKFFDASGLTVELLPTDVIYSRQARQFEGESVLLDVLLNGERLPDHQNFLNEARLSALALAIFLAGYELSIPPPIAGGTEYARVLVLDDILISLDMSNRLPVLDILKDRFSSWQIILLTHDRAWYEIARQQLRPDGNWEIREVFARRLDGTDIPVILDDSDRLLRALAYFEQGHVKAAAVFVREEFEVILKEACQELCLQVQFQTSFRNVTANHLWGALKDSKRPRLIPAEYKILESGRTIQLPSKEKEVRTIPEALRDRVNHALSWVLNPLSHSEPIDRYSREVEDAIYAIDDLGRAVRRTIQQDHDELVFERRVILGMMLSKSLGPA